jgi:hypothetical protein
MNRRKEIDEIRRLVELISALLAGQPSQIQGAVLADLTATWLGGHGVVGNDEATAAAHEDLLKLQFDLVRKLIPINTPAVFIKSQGKA